MSESPMRSGRVQLPWRARLRHVVTLLALAILLGACEGGSGQSGTAFVFLSVDGFFLTQGQDHLEHPLVHQPGHDDECLRHPAEQCEEPDHHRVERA